MQSEAIADSFVGFSPWEKLISWLGKHVEALAKSSCEQVQQQIINRGDKLN